MTMPRRDAYDVVVIGAGPAGLAAAATSAEAGLSTLLLDENIGPGGQVFRAISSTPVTDRNQLGADYWVGADLVQSLVDAECHHAAESGQQQFRLEIHRRETRATCAPTRMSCRIRWQVPSDSLQAWPFSVSSAGDPSSGSFRRWRSSARPAK